MAKQRYNTGFPTVTDAIPVPMPAPSAPYASAVFEYNDQRINLPHYHEALESKKVNKLGTHKAKVAVILDISGSMEFQNNLFSSGSVQRFIDKSLGMAAAFDDDREMEFFTFGQNSRFEGKINMGNRKTFLPDLIQRSGGLEEMLEGRTDYGEAVKTANDYYFENGKKSDVPVFALFLTDGDCNDDKKSKAKREIINASQNPMFIKFIAIGASEEQFPFLNELDDMRGRKIDNVDVVFAKNPDELQYNDLIREYRGFVVEAKKKEMFTGAVGFSDKEFIKSENRTVESRNVVGNWTSNERDRRQQQQVDAGCGCVIL